MELTGYNVSRFIETTINYIYFGNEYVKKD